MIGMTALDKAGLVRHYGQPPAWFDWEPGDEEIARDGRPGVLVDHLRTAAEIDGVRIVEGAMCAYVVDDHADGIAYPVLCGEIVEVWTEDGPTDGRCGAIATDITEGACAGHAAERRGWRDLTEAEKAHWEREHDRVNP